MKRDRYITREAAQELRSDIAESEGREVVAVGKMNGEGMIASLAVVARGTPEAAPAVMAYLEKGDVVLHNHPSGNLSPSQADLAVASRLGEQGIGFYIIDNSADRVYRVVEAVKKKANRRLPIESLVSLVSPGGRMEKISGYEFRQAQADMLRMVAENMNEGTSCAVEAGTGVGKSLAYLLPAVEWAATNGERVIVSTATINLQQQLIERDIPMVKQLLSRDLKAVLVKGRGNYLCRRRLEQTVEELDLFSEDDGETAALRDWAESTETGSKSDLPFYPKDELWSSVCSETETCLGMRCNHREGCFFLKSRREAASAGLLVVNHHLLFSDLSLRAASSGFEGTAVLPPFSKIIFDEAHAIERSATSYFSESFSRYTLERSLSRLYRVKRGREFGLLNTLKGIVTNAKPLESIPSDIDDLNEHMKTLDDIAGALVEGESSRRLHPAEEPERYTTLLAELQEVEGCVRQIASRLRDSLEEIGDEDEDSPLLYEVKLLIRRLQAVASICSGFRDFRDRPEKIFYIELLRGKRKSARFTIAPLDITEIMKKAVFEPFSGIVFTSATLTIRGDFSYWMKRSGLTGQGVETGLFPSPFPYMTNVLLGSPREAPSPSDHRYTGFLSNFICDVLELSEGGGLVLFTSYSMLRETWKQSKERLKEHGIPVSKQGDDDRGRLLDRFREDTRSVLFATDSFWEGVDTPGEALKVLILCRLPFRVPSDPIVVARMEAVETAGGNPFKEISLPDAVMRFKQGFGRLMRRSTDRGVICITDTRILNKSYGSVFLDSVPETGRSFKESAYLLQDIESFLYPPRV